MQNISGDISYVAWKAGFLNFILENLCVCSLYENYHFNLLIIYFQSHTLEVNFFFDYVISIVHLLWCMMPFLCFYFTSDLLLL